MDPRRVKLNSMQIPPARRKKKSQERSAQNNGPRECHWTTNALRPVCLPTKSLSHVFREPQTETWENSDAPRHSQKVAARSGSILSRCELRTIANDLQPKPTRNVKTELPPFPCCDLNDRKVSFFHSLKLSIIIYEHREAIG
jgi:hypothetical protein